MMFKNLVMQPRAAILILVNVSLCEIVRVIYFSTFLFGVDKLIAYAQN